MKLEHQRWLFYTALAGVIVLGFPTSALAQPYVPGISSFGRSNYIEYISGELPVIFSAPHGGSLQPAEIPARTYGTFTTDSNTEDLGRKLRTEFGNRFGLLPHVILCRLDRDKIDCNREIVEGAQGDPEAEIAWNEFHNFIGASVTNVTERHGRGFYIDIHGHGHTIQRLELGYRLTDTQLNLSDATLNSSATYQNSSSIRTLSVESPLAFAALLRGSNSFGGFISNEGYPSVPSPATPGPGTDPYFDGGYNTDRYGSSSGGNIDSLQIESNYAGVRDFSSNRTAFAQSLARVAEAFFLEHYGVNLRETLPKAWLIGGGNFGTATNWLNRFLPVSTNHLLFAGAGGNLTNNLDALTGAGVIGSITFSNAGSYTMSGNPCSLLRGVTNLAAVAQMINNHLTLAGPQTFMASLGSLLFGGNVTNNGHQLQILGNVTVNGVLSGGGGLIKSGAGTLTLAAINSYSGGTIVNAGALLVNNAVGSVTGSSFVAVSNNATLGGTGPVAGPVTCAGVIAPGASTGVLTLGGGLSLSAGGIYKWDLAAPATLGEGTNFDLLALTNGNLSLGGTSVLQLNFLNLGATPNAADPFWLTSHAWRIISLAGNATNNGRSRFTTILNASFPTGTFTNYADGLGNVWLGYIAAPALSPLIQSAGLDGTSLTLSFSTETNRTYVIQTTTNLAPANWLNVSTNIAPGLSLTFTNLGRSEPVKFYRVFVWP